MNNDNNNEYALTVYKLNISSQHSNETYLSCFMLE